MAETPQKPVRFPPGDELSMEKRLLLAFGLMAAVLFVTQLFFQPPPPQKTIKPAERPQAARAAKPAPTQSAADGGTQASAQIMGDAPRRYTVDTEVYRIVFSNRGGVVESWQLKKYRDGKGKPLELVNTAAQGRVPSPFSLAYKEQKPSVDLNQALFATRLSTDGLQIDFEFASGTTRAKKTFRFLRDSYLSEISSEISEAGRRLSHYLLWRGGFGDSSVVSAAAAQHTVYFDATKNELVTNDAKAAKNGPVTASGAFHFAGIQDQYFAAVFLPLDETAVEVQTWQDVVPDAGEQKEQPHVGVAVRAGERNRFSLFTGPKDIDLLRRVNPKLASLVDFGWFGFLAKPLFLCLNWVHDHWVHNYGWAIVLVTVGINFLLLPLKLSSLRSMKKMQALQPEIQALNEKYKNISLRDPRKAQQNQELMELYKKHGVNPMGGCMPLLLQIPFFIAFYKVLSVAIELRGASWLWVTDLSQPETLPIRILPLAMILTQYVLQKMTPATGADPAQQRIMLLMPFLMGFMFYGVSSGLVLYWLTGNLVGIAQQWVMNRMAAAPSAVQTSKSPAATRGSRASRK